jgi:hypothetical protein
MAATTHPNPRLTHLSVRSININTAIFGTTADGSCRVSNGSRQETGLLPALVGAAPALPKPIRALRKRPVLPEKGWMAAQWAAFPVAWLQTRIHVWLAWCREGIHVCRCMVSAFIVTSLELERDGEGPLGE